MPPGSNYPVNLVAQDGTHFSVSNDDELAWAFAMPGTRYESEEEAIARGSAQGEADRYKGASNAVQGVIEAGARGFSGGLSDFVVGSLGDKYTREGLAGRKAAHPTLNAVVEGGAMLGSALAGGGVLGKGAAEFAAATPVGLLSRTSARFAEKEVAGAGVRAAAKRATRAGLAGAGENAAISVGMHLGAYGRGEEKLTAEHLITEPGRDALIGGALVGGALGGAALLQRGRKALKATDLFGRADDAAVRRAGAEARKASDQATTALTEAQRAAQDRLKQVQIADSHAEARARERLFARQDAVPTGIYGEATAPSDAAQLNIALDRAAKPPHVHGRAAAPVEVTGEATIPQGRGGDAELNAAAYAAFEDDAAAINSAIAKDDAAEAAKAATEARDAARGAKADQAAAERAAKAEARAAAAEAKAKKMEAEAAKNAKAREAIAKKDREAAEVQANLDAEIAAAPEGAPIGQWKLDAKAKIAALKAEAKAIREARVSEIAKGSEPAEVAAPAAKKAPHARDLEAQVKASEEARVRRMMPDLPTRPGDRGPPLLAAEQGQRLHPGDEVIGERVYEEVVRTPDTSPFRRYEAPAPTAGDDLLSRLQATAERMKAGEPIGDLARGQEAVPGAFPKGSQPTGGVRLDEAAINTPDAAGVTPLQREMATEHPEAKKLVDALDEAHAAQQAVRRQQFREAMAGHDPRAALYVEALAAQAKAEDALREQWTVHGRHLRDEQGRSLGRTGPPLRLKLDELARDTPGRWHDAWRVSNPSERLALLEALGPDDTRMLIGYLTDAERAEVLDVLPEALRAEAMKAPRARKAVIQAPPPSAGGRNLEFFDAGVAPSPKEVAQAGKAIEEARGALKPTELAVPQAKGSPPAGFDLTDVSAPVTRKPLFTEADELEAEAYRYANDREVSAARKAAMADMKPEAALEVGQAADGIAALQRLDAANHGLVSILGPAAPASAVELAVAREAELSAQASKSARRMAQAAQDIPVGQVPQMHPIVPDLTVRMAGKPAGSPPSMFASLADEEANAVRKAAKGAFGLGEDVTHPPFDPDWTMKVLPGDNLGSPPAMPGLFDGWGAVPPSPGRAGVAKGKVPTEGRFAASGLRGGGDTYRRFPEMPGGRRPGVQSTLSEVASTAAAPPAVYGGGGGILGKLADAGAAFEAARWLGVTHTVDFDKIPVIGPVVRLYLKYRGVRMAANQFGIHLPGGPAKVHAIAGAGKARMYKAVDKLLAGGQHGMKALGVVGMSQAWRLDDALRKPLDPSAVERDKRKQMSLAELTKARAAEARALAANPEAAASSVRRRIAALEDTIPVDPDLVDAAVETQQRANEYLAKHAPVEPPPSLFRKVVWEPILAESVKFARRVRAVRDPATVYQDIANGTLTTEAAEAFREVYPAMYEDTRARLLEQAAQLEVTLSPSYVASLSILFRVPLRPTLDPDNIRRLQEAGVPPHPTGVPGGAAVAAPPGGAPDLASASQVGPYRPPAQ